MRLIRRRRQRPVAGSACRSRCSRRLDTLFQPRRARPCSSSPRCPCGDARAVREIGGGCPTTSLLLGSGRPSSSLTPEDPILGALHCASSTRVRLCLAPYRSCWQPPLSVVGEVGGAMEELTEEPAELVARVCAVDIGKAGLVVCVRVPHETRPGRPKTDKLDAVWLAKVVERGMCRPSLVHPKPIRRLRDVTRYRRSLVREQTREKLRLEKILEDAQIKLDSVISDLHGVCGRQMLQALVEGCWGP